MDTEEGREIGDREKETGDGQGKGRIRKEEVI